MDFFGSLFLAFSMYSRLPVPSVAWSDRRMKHTMCFFPLIGVVEGFLLYLSLWFFRHFGSGNLFPALFGTALPILVTGGIHMDGFLDVTDARHSYGSREEKLRIMKDPHIGAFACVGAAVFFLLYAGAFSEISEAYGSGDISCVFVVSGLYVLERSLSGLSLMIFPMAKKDGLAATFSGRADKRTDRVVLTIFAAMAAVWMVFAGKITGALTALGVLFVFRRYYVMAVRDYGGTTGDLAGWFLETAELAGVIIIAFCILLR